MSKAKRITACIMAVAMMLSVTAVMANDTVTSAVDATNADSAPLPVPERYLRNVEFLSALKIYNFQNEQFDGTVTRAVFAQMIADLMGDDTSTTEEKELFIDVNGGTKYRQAINFVYDAGIMNGTGNGQFNPDDAITYVQAIKTVVTMLGYQPIADGTGGYFAGYMNSAGKLGLLKNGPSNYEAPLTYEKAAELLCHIVETPVFEAVGVYGDRVIFEGTSDKTFLNAYHNIYTGTGVMTDNGVTKTNGKTACNKECVQIGEYRFFGATEAMRNFIGCNLEYYYSDNGGIYTLLYAELKNCEIVTLNASVLDIQNSAFTAQNIIATESGKTKKYKIDPYANVLYNGALDETFTTETLKIEEGEIRLVDADNDGDFDLVCVEEYADMIVHRYVAGKNLVAAYGPDELKNIVFEDYEHIVYEDANGNPVDANIIKANDVVSVYKSKNNEKIRFVVYDKNEEVTVDSVTTGDNGDIVINYFGKSAELSETYKRLLRDKASVYPYPQGATSYRIYYNFEGHVTMLVETEGRSQYAYLLAIAYKNNNLGSKTVEMKFLLENNEVAVITAAKKVSINKVTGNTGADIMGDSRIVKNGEVIPQLTWITLNSKGELTGIEVDDSVDNGLYQFDLENFSLDYYAASNASRYGGMGFTNVNGTLCMTPNTKMFVIREGGSDLQTTDETMIEVLPYSRMSEIYDSTYYKLYDADETWEVGAAVVSAKVTVTQYTRFFFVDDAKTIIDENGDHVVSVSGYLHGAYVTYQESEPGIFEDAVRRRYPGSTGGLKKGDILSVGWNLDRKMAAVDMVYSPMRDNDPNYSFIDTSHGGSMETGDIIFTLGFLCANKDARLSLYYKKNKDYLTVRGGKTTSPEQFWVTGFAGGGSIMHFDVQTQELKKVTIEDFVGTGQLTATGFTGYDPDCKVLICRFRGIAFDALLITGLSANY